MSTQDLTYIHLVRHCAARGTGVRFVGRSDPPLSPAGRRHARAVQRRLRRLHPAVVVTSPARRARETLGDLDALGTAVHVDADLWELDFGDWESAPPPNPVIAWDDPSFAFPKGESMAAFWDRVAAAAARWCSGSRSVLWCTHGAVIAAAVCVLLRLPRSAAASLYAEPGSIATIIAGDTGRWLWRFNDTPGEEGAP